MTEKTNEQKLADLATKEKAETAKVADKIIRDTAKDAGIAEDMIGEFMLARGAKYGLGPDGKPRHLKSGALMTEHLAKLKEKRSGYWRDANKSADTANAAETLADLAFVKTPSPKLQGDLVKLVGETVAREMATARGTKLGSVKPGRAVADTGEKKPADNGKRDNPWLAANWNISEQGRIVRVLGLDKAAGIAAAAGCKIGDTKPAKSAA